MSFACVLECLWTHDMVYASASLEDDDGRRGLDAVIKAVEREVLRPRAGGFMAGLWSAAPSSTLKCAPLPKSLTS